jgi:hypothetical protein
MPASTVCLLTAYNAGFRSIAEVTVPRMRALADSHDYHFRAIKRDDCSRRGGWIKIEPICAALAENFDFVFWIDTDALILRHDIDVRTAAVEGADLHMTWHGADTSRLDGPPFSPHYNSGVVLIRANDWSRDFFTRVWNVGQLLHIWADQAAIYHLLGYDALLSLGVDRPDEPSRSHIAKLDTAWNAIPGVGMAADPIIHHYAGGPRKICLELLKVDAKTLRVRKSADRKLREAFS